MSTFRITPEQLAGLPPDFRALLETVIDHYKARIAQLEWWIADLQGRLGKTPQNSSLPPDAAGTRPGAAATSGVGIALDEAARHRIPPPSADLPWGRDDDLSRVARGRPAGDGRVALQRRMTPVRRTVERLPLRGIQSGHRSLVGICRELYEHRSWLWAFVRQPGVEPTNNVSERALLWRKLSYGTQSATGSRFVETMLTVIEACRQQEHSAFDYLTEAIQAHRATSLLPRA